MRLIPKNPGLRTIGLFRSQYRLWAKANREPVRAWARGLCAARPYLNTGETRQIGDRTYRLEIKRLVTPGAEKKVAAEAMWDLHKAFDMVPRKVVVGKLRTMGYPELQLRVSMASYAWARIILIVQLAGRWLLTTRGVLAGSAYGMFELLGMTVLTFDQAIQLPRSRSRCTLTTPVFRMRPTTRRSWLRRWGQL